MTPEQRAEKGQILPSSTFGEWLIKCAYSANTILEVGTWHGLGSTLCLSMGLVRPEQRLWTIEPDAERHAEAQTYYNDPRMTFIHGRALDVLDQLPERIDLLLLDGDDLSTDAEWDALKDRTSVVALDDTRERKNRRQRDLLSRDPDWRFLVDILHERNGWMIAARH